MPELPEVETVCRGLRATVLGKSIVSVETDAPASSIVVSRSVPGGEFTKALKNRTIIEIARRGKNILITLSGELVLWVHLKMTGHFFYDENLVTPGKHDLIIFTLSKPRADNTSLRASHASRDRSNPSLSYLRFNDYRRFGRNRLFTSDEIWNQKGLCDLGPEPLEISATDFVSLCKRRPRQLKQALLDQTFIAGVGNIYADESLWAARLHPKRLTTSVSPAKLTELHSHIQRLLKLAIRKAGTSVDSYSGVNGRPGSFQKYLRVYDREGEPCRRCDAKIVRKKIGSRSAHFCPKCQRV
jgi:formamidopyrimidine-DNA glycosylase